MPRGQITRLEPAHGFGWLVDSAGLEWFFVQDGVAGGSFDAIEVDELVVFSSEWTPNGPRAAEIRAQYPQHAE